MERRVLLAIFLSFLVLYAYQMLLVPPPAPRPDGEAPAASSIPAPGSGPGSPAAAAPGSTAAAPPAGTAAAGGTATPTADATPLVGEASERDIRIETRDVIAVFTNRGARLKSWRLKHFLDDSGQPLDLVASDLAATHPLPFTLQTDDQQVSAALNDGLYAVGGTPAGVVTESPGADLRFEYRTASLHAVKEFHVDPSSYVIGVKTSVSVNGQSVAPAVQWGPGPGDVTHQSSQYVLKARGIIHAADEVERLDASDIASQQVHEGDFRYAGVDDHYFLTVALTPGPSRIAFQAVSIPARTPDESTRDLVAFTISPPPQRVFFGPKDFDLLGSIDRELVRAIDYGMFSVIVVPLLRSLKWVNGYVGNFGWSIVILTIIINAIMFPLRHKSVVSMRKMQELQPEVKAIQDRYKHLKATDPAKQKMNQEMMTLYRERGVNPASGCVPLLLTMPVLFAFWSLLSYSIELRGAPFFGWIRDLSTHDPIYVFPLLMGASAFWQAKMTPVSAGADPIQQKMMTYLMPGMMTFFFLWAPAGLAVYYFVSNIWAIGQQYATNYIIGPPNVPKIRPPAERQMKRAGAGKTSAAS
jgi:YidC/Oxa1 family membrane protein insertase